MNFIINLKILKKKKLLFKIINISLLSYKPFSNIYPKQKQLYSHKTKKQNLGMFERNLIDAYTQ